MLYKNFFKAVVTALGVSIFGGCVSMSTLEKDSRLENDESIFVIGVRPENFRISVFPGSIENGQFSQSLIRSAVVFAFPRDGYVVAKARAGDVLAVLMVTPYKEGAFLKPTYAACDGGKTLTFKVPAGKVIYISDIKYSYSGSGIAISFSQNFSSARQFINNNYAALQDKLEEWPSEFLTSSKSCATPLTVTVPRYN